MPNKKNLHSFGLILNFLVIFFTVITAVAVLGFANGYRFDLNNFRVEKVGVIIINSTPNIVNVEINGDVYEINALNNIISLYPGRYEILISRSGYKNWTSAMRIESGQGMLFDNIILYLSSPQLIIERKATENEKLEIPKADLVFNNGELRIIDLATSESKLITRFADDILAANMLDEHHIVFQINKEIRVIETSGSNDTPLIDLELKEPVKLFSRQNGSILRIIDNKGILKEFRIR